MCILPFLFMWTKARATPLGGITFPHNKTLTDVKRLSALFPSMTERSSAARRSPTDCRSCRRLTRIRLRQLLRRFLPPPLTTNRNWPSSKSTWTRASSFTSAASKRLGQLMGEPVLHFGLRGRNAVGRTVADDAGRCRGVLPCIHGGAGSQEAK